ncbi:MAG: hypothetical protein H6738_24405 [Alphaproteobacteria bacterium]|nr:hypothetical protein [Alphaproteobacteria bacterium]
MIPMLAWVAHADVVGPGPNDCPPGARGDSDHNGSFCAPTACEGICPEGWGTCGPVGLCIVESERPCNGDAPAGCTFHHAEAVGGCEHQEDCAEGTCVVADRCATAVAPPPPSAPAPGGWGCAPGAALVVGGLPLALIGGRRRRG